jgi:hypothetical protein
MREAKLFDEDWDEQAECRYCETKSGNSESINSSFSIQKSA